MNTVNVSGRVPMLFNMSKYCVISSKSTTSFDEAPLICSFDVKSLMEFLRPSTIAFLCRATPTPDALDAAGHFSRGSRGGRALAFEVRCAFFFLCAWSRGLQRRLAVARGVRALN